MIAFQLPAYLTAALDRLSHGVSRKHAAVRATAISSGYRSGGNSRSITDSADALAYAIARMPATYAAVAASFATIQQARADFAPRSLLDIGAGPGTASFAAMEMFPDLASLTLLDQNPALRAIALELGRDHHTAAATTYLQGHAAALLARCDAADLVVASYLIGELTIDAQRQLGDAMWAKTRDMLVVIEPGTPAGYERLMVLRAHLIAQGAHVIAPCPHDAACPLIKPDWCHFSQRLQRSRDHIRLKNAELPFEDERYAYVALARAPLAERSVRILAPPLVTKVEVTAKLCSKGGVSLTRIPRRDKNGYALARKWRWGDAADLPDTP